MTEITPRSLGTTSRGPVFEAWTTSNIEEMLAVAHIRDCSPVDRHFLLLALADSCFKQRKKDPKLKQLALLYSEQHIQEFASLAGPLLQSTAIGNPDDEDYCPPEGTLPNVPTFKNYATMLVEERRYKEAISVISDASRYPFEEPVKAQLVKLLGRIKRELANTSKSPIKAS